MAESSNDFPDPESSNKEVKAQVMYEELVKTMLETNTTPTSNNDIANETLQEAFNFILACSLTDFENLVAETNNFPSSDIATSSSGGNKTTPLTMIPDRNNCLLTPPLNDKSFACHLCDYKSKQKGNLMTHMRKHTGEKPYRCNACDYSAKQKTQLVNHMKRHRRTHPSTSDQHRLTPTPPENFCYKRVRSLEDELLQGGVKPFKCQICDYAAKQKSTLVTHMRSHTGEKPYRCHQCSYTAKQQTQLTNHLRAHENKANRLQSWICPTCKTQFKSKNHLMTHTRIHSAEKPFQCHVCEYASHQKGNLMTHMRKHTGEKPFQCHLCDYSAKQRPHLAHHLKNHTKVVVTTIANWTTLD